MKNMTLDAIAKAVGGILYNIENYDGSLAEGVEIDSRKVEKGYIFIAIKGARADGHDFIDQVYEKGAMAVVSERVLPLEKRPYIKVSSSEKALRDMAEYYRGNLNVKVVGITGSVGKTSTKEFVAAALSSRYKVLKTEGNFNNEIGLPLTVLKIREEHEIAVIEMGISHFGDMKPLGEIAKPDICLITNIGCCHLENLIDRDGVLKEKTSMFDYAGEDGEYVLNLDDDKLATISEVRGKKPVFTSLESKTDVYCKRIKESHIDGSRCVVDIYGEETEVFVPIPGKHMILNALMACAVGKMCNVSSEQIKEGIEGLKPVTGRVNIVRTSEYTLIDDCYNANPVSMKASVDVLMYAPGSKIAILGDMFELGDRQHELHRSVGLYIADKSIDTLVTIGELSMDIERGALEKGYTGKCFHFADCDEFIGNSGKIIMRDGAETILVKASHGMHLEKIINSLTK